jgi:hypothetical protein
MAPKTRIPLERFKTKFIADESTQCWLWNSTKDKDGYGKFFIPPNRNDRAHRVSYELFKGNIPRGYFVCHKCDTPGCVNPDHLFLGDSFTNMQDCAATGRHRELKKTHCKNGHIFDAENTYLWRKERHCRKCRGIAQKNRY